MDTLTDQIIKQLDGLPIVKKKALLELIKKNVIHSKEYDNDTLEKWRSELLTTSVWTDSEINEIYKAMDYLFKNYPSKKITSVEDIFYWDNWARKEVKEYLDKKC